MRSQASVCACGAFDSACRCRASTPAGPSGTTQPRSLRPRVNAPQDNRSLLTDSVDTPAVYAVPKAYWMADVDCEGAATVHCEVEGPKVIGIYVGEEEGDVELDFGSATKLFPARTAAQWLVQDTEQALLHLRAYEAAGHPRSTGRSPSPHRASPARSTSMAVSARSAAQEANAARVTHGSSARGVRGRARPVPDPEPEVRIVREPLPIRLPTPVTAPAYVTGEAKKWVEVHKHLVRAWASQSLAGAGLKRNVPTAGQPMPDAEVRDAYLVSTDALVAELEETLIKQYVARIGAVRAAWYASTPCRGAGTPSSPRSYDAAASSGRPSVISSL